MFMNTKIVGSDGCNKFVEKDLIRGKSFLKLSQQNSFPLNKSNGSLKRKQKLNVPKRLNPISKLELHFQNR